MKQPQPGAIIHIIGQLCGTFAREGWETPAILITDLDIITKPSPTASTPTNTPPRPSRLRYGPTTGHGSPTSIVTSATPAHESNYSSSMPISTPISMPTLPAQEAQDESPDTMQVSTVHTPKHSPEVTDGTISDLEEAPRSSKRRRIPTHKAVSSEQ